MMKLVERTHRREGRIMIGVELGEYSSIEELPEQLMYSLAAWKKHNVVESVAYYEHAGLASTNSPFTRVQEADQE